MNEPTIVQLPGAPIRCALCGRAVRIAVVTATGRYCPCGARLPQPPETPRPYGQEAA